MTIGQFPAKFGKYILLDRLNAGGMAEVFRAKVTGVEGFERLVAIKCMLPALISDAQFTDMFVDEARLAAQLNHPNIVQIYELGRHAERLYIAMELIAGHDLRHISRAAGARTTNIPQAFAAYVIAKAAEGLDFAHRKASVEGRPLGLVHRDVSPQNILVSYDGEVKVVDFGIAKANAEVRNTHTQAGVLKGKFAYMAPEQVLGGAIDHRADIFALGSVLFELVTGERLFADGSDLAVLERIREAKITDLEARLPAHAHGLLPTLNKALHQDPNARFQYASEMAESLEPLLIADGTIFGSKRAAQLMRTLYDVDVGKLQQDMRTFADVSESSCVVIIGEDGTLANAKMVLASTFGPPRTTEQALAAPDVTPVVALPQSMDFVATERHEQPESEPKSDTPAPLRQVTLIRRNPLNGPRPPSAAESMRLAQQKSTQRKSLSSVQNAAPVSAPAPARSHPLDATAPPAVKASDTAQRHEPTDRKNASSIAIEASIKKSVQRVKWAVGASLIATILCLGWGYYRGANFSGLGQSLSSVMGLRPMVQTRGVFVAAFNGRTLGPWVFNERLNADGTTVIVPYPTHISVESDVDLDEGAGDIKKFLPSSEALGYLRLDVANTRHARIFIDGKDYGMAPLADVALGIGTHRLRIVQEAGGRRLKSRQLVISVKVDHTQARPLHRVVTF